MVQDTASCLIGETPMLSNGMEVELQTAKYLIQTYSLK